jgi:hypothetical protein
MNEEKFNEIMIVNSKIPIFRAGWTNFLFIVIAIFIILLIQAYKDSYIFLCIVISIFIVYSIVVYLSSVSRVSIVEGKVFIVCSVNNIEIHLNTIKNIRICPYSWGNFTILEIKCKDKIFSRSFVISGGGYTPIEMAEKLKKMFAQHISQ